MLDYYPGIRVIVRDLAGELVTVGMEELLPYAYVISKSPTMDEGGLEIKK